MGAAQKEKTHKGAHSTHPQLFSHELGSSLESVNSFVNADRLEGGAK
jgi:hypothetical protein